MVKNRKSQRQNNQSRSVDQAKVKDNGNAPSVHQQSDDGIKKTEASKEGQLTTNISPWWLVFCCLDLFLNSCSVERNVNDLYGNFNPLLFPIQLSIPEPLSVTIHQLWIASLARGILLFQLFYTFTYRNSNQTWIKYSCYINLGAVPIFCVHLVARILLDSEVIEDLTFPSYWVIVAWNAIAFGTLGFLNWRLLCYLSPDEDGTGDDVLEKGKKEKGQAWGNRSTLFKLLVWYRPHIVQLLFGYVFLFIHASVEAVVPRYKAKLIDDIKSERPMEDLTVYVLYMAVLPLVGTLSMTLWSCTTSMVRSKLHFRIRCRLFRWMVNQDMTFFDRTKSGELTSCLSSEAESLGSVLSRIDSIIKTGTTLAGMTLVMFRLSWQLTLVVLTGNIFIVVITHFYGVYTKSIHKMARQCRRQANVIAQEVMSSMKTVRSFGSEEEEIKRYSAKTEEQYRLEQTESWLRPSHAAIEQLINVSLMAVTILYGGHLAMKGRITSGVVVSFAIYLNKMAGSMSTLVKVYTMLMRVLGASEKVLQYLNATPEAPPDGQEAPPTLEGRLEFKDVTFAYPTRPGANVIDKLSFRIDPGEVVALVGPSGAGKTTCFNLLQRFYPPTSGQVVLDSRPLADYKNSYLRSKVATVSQEPTLFARSLQENICYGLDPADVIDDDVIRTAKNANAASFIETFPDGYNTYVGERGLQLSGGQKQRVAIARALIRDPRILLLDEATSALDLESETKVQEALARTMAGRTVVIIAHRLSTVQQADRILVLNRGSIVEEGSHADLLRQRGLYYKLVKRQLLK